MSRNLKKLLNKKMQVNLPDTLNKENILSEIDSPEIQIIDTPQKKNTLKRLVPVAASLMLVVGIVGMYFGMGMGDKKADKVPDDKTDVMFYQSYDAIYEKFDELHKAAKKNNFTNGFNYFGDMLAGGAEVGMPSADGTTDDSEKREEVATGTTSNKEYGSTNTQEAGVDEGDIIKTDGNYLYIVNADSNKSISIVGLADKKMTESAQIDFENNESVSEIYIYGDKLVVVGAFSEKNEEEALEKHMYYRDGCVALGFSNTFVKVYDISDRKNPKMITEYSQQGGYDNSRMIDSKLYVISEYHVDVYAEDYRDNCIPETQYNGVKKPIEAGCIHVLIESNSSTYAVITTLDLTKNSEPESQAVLGNCDNLYASAKGMFLAETDLSENGQHFTKIYKFDYTDTGVRHMCTGKVDGYLNNQFSMSYDGEYFRVATTVNKVEESDDTVSFSLDNSVNNLYILNNNMQVAGKVEDLAKGETIESVRFAGNMAYVVTFRQTDPLFVIDLSDSQNPTVKGELKIPGFSEYLHPIADGFLIGVGQDGTETGTNGDCKVSLFNVTNPYKPEETSVLPVANGKGYCYTSVSNNHKLYINLSENEFAVPFAIHKYVNGSKENLGGDYYIRYRLTGDGLCEVNRYYIGNNDSSVMGATYVGDVFYVVTNNFEEGTYVTAFDLVSHEEIGRLRTAEWRSK